MDRDNEALRRRLEESQAAQDSDDSEQTVRTDAVRAIDPELMSGPADAADEPEGRQLQADVPPDLERRGPGDLPESVDVATAAPDGTAIGGRGAFTSPTGESIGGSGLSDAIESRGGEINSGSDAFDRGLDFDPLSPGTNETGAGASGGGDADLDRMLMGRDGSLYSADRKLKDFDEKPSGGTPQPKPKEEPPAKDWTDRLWDSLTGGGGAADAGTGGKRVPTPTEGGGGWQPPEYYDNPTDDTVEGEINLERVTVMQGSATNPSRNPDDQTGTPTDENFIPPQDLVTRPTDEGEATHTTLTSAATLGSSPVVNPTDPVLGDDGIIHGSYAGGSGSGTGGGGGETTPQSTAAGDASAMGGEGDANLPITADKADVNGARVDMATGQVIGSAAPAMGGELDASGGAQAFTAGDAAMADASMALGAPTAMGRPDSLAPPPDVQGPPSGEEGEPTGSPPGSEG